MKFLYKKIKIQMHKYKNFNLMLIGGGFYMKKQKLNLLKKGVISLIVSLLVITPTMPIANAASSKTNYSSAFDMITNWFTETKNSKQFLSEVYDYINGVDKNIPVDEFKSQILTGLLAIQEKYSGSLVVSRGTSRIALSTLGSQAKSTPDLLSEIVGVVTNLLNSGNLALQSLTPNKEVSITAETAGDGVNLVGKIYYAETDERSGKLTSNKWALLLHGVLMNGQAMADAVGEMYLSYLDQGYNILAIDSRGHGDSDGSVAMGYLESLDAWDWLTYLNTNEECDQVIIHGTSLGGATTVFTTGLKIGNETIKDKNVIGVIEDCGYTSLTGIISGMLGGTTSNELVANVLGILNITDLSILSGVDSAINSVIKTLLINVVNVGLTEENFDEKQDALKYVNNWKVPMLIIHGTTDTTVPYSNSDNIFKAAEGNTSVPYIQRYSAEGQPHAFVMIGNKYNAYKTHVQTFIQRAEYIDEKGKLQSGVSRVVDSIDVPEEDATLLTSLLKALKLIKNMLG